MCYSCYVDAGGEEVVLTSFHKQVANKIWDWYQAEDKYPGEVYPINGCGGALHVQLDDFNLEDGNLTDNWKYQYGDERELYPYTPETLALGQEIVEALRKMTEPERNAVVWHAQAYEPERPFE